MCVCISGAFKPHAITKPASREIYPSEGLAEHHFDPIFDPQSILNHACLMQIGGEIGGEIRVEFRGLTFTETALNSRHARSALLKLWVFQLGDVIVVAVPLCDHREEHDCGSRGHGLESLVKPTVSSLDNSVDTALKLVLKRENTSRAGKEFSGRPGYKIEKSCLVRRDNSRRVDKQPGPVIAVWGDPPRQIQVVLPEYSI
ncbi:hypothetical protein RRG08_022532 [Elysia crispata]|uniref:Uncharacterized protein n=1 Tax=Elysia crispata TaxID=231223 RepID=A0AAE1D998_9GAST|nr:hypothetical protein RRG08_022532 [Elysia crispata]